MNGIKRGIAYTKDELNMALPAYGFVVVYLLALIPNDFRLIDSPLLLAVNISGRVCVSLVVPGEVGTMSSGLTNCAVFGPPIGSGWLMMYSSRTPWQTPPSGGYS